MERINMDGRRVKFSYREKTGGDKKGEEEKKKKRGRKKKEKGEKRRTSDWAREQIRQ